MKPLSRWQLICSCRPTVNIIVKKQNGVDAFRRIFNWQKNSDSFIESLSILCAYKTGLYWIEVKEREVKYYGKHSEKRRQLSHRSLYGI